MGQILDQHLIYAILAVVDEIPEGQTATYGQIARLIGREKMHASLDWYWLRPNISGDTRATGWSTMPVVWHLDGRNKSAFWKPRACPSKMPAMLI